MVEFTNSSVDADNIKWLSFEGIAISFDVSGTHTQPGPDRASARETVSQASVSTP